MLVKSHAIILRTVKYGESRMIVDAFTREGGRLSFAASMPKTGRGKIKKQFFQPMTIVDVEYDYRPRVQLQRFVDVSLTVPYRSVSIDPHKLSISLFISEFLSYALRGEQKNEQLFDYVVGSMQWLDNSTTSIANFHIVFLMRLSLFLGFYPNLDDYHEGCCFDLRAAQFSATLPLHRDFLAADEAAKVSLMMRMNFATMHLFRMSRAERNRLVDIIISYYRLHIPDFPELRSLAVMRELFV